MERVGEWFRFTADHYARVNTLYPSMAWGHNVAFSTAMNVCIAPYGGPIAIVRGDALPGSIAIAIYGGGGVLIRQFLCPAEAGSTVISCGWNNEESLVLLTSKYTCIVYELSQQAANPTTASVSSSLLAPAHSFKMAPNAPQLVPSLHIVRGSGLYTLDSDGTLRCVTFEERKEPQLVNFSAGVGQSECTCLEVLPPEMSDEGTALIFIAKTVLVGRSRSGSVVCVNTASDETTDLKLKLPVPVAGMSLCLSMESIALLTEDGILLIMSSNFQEKRYSVDLGVIGAKPTSLDWAGSGFVLITYYSSDFDDSASADQLFSLLVSTHKTTETRMERLSWDEGSGKYAIIPEIDGIRVVTESAHYFIEEVDPVLVNLCRLKSTSAAAKLAAAQQQFAAGEVRGLLYVRNLVKERQHAFCDVVDELLDAALMEFDVEQQERILTVAAFANNFCSSNDAEKYTGVLSRLRILNALRDQQVGVAVSIRQYERLSSAQERLRAIQPSEAQVLVDRLVNRRSFSTALDICQLMHMKPNKILVQWSCMHVQNKSIEDSKVRQDISRVLSQCPGASYIDASLAAFRCGREQLAIHLLNDDPRSQNKVILLLQMDQNELALKTAVESDDSDLVHFVLIHLMTNMSQQQLLNTLSGHESARNTLCLSATMLSAWRDRVKALLEDTRQHYRLGMWRLERKLLGDDCLDPNTTPPAPMMFSMDDDGIVMSGGDLQRDEPEDGHDDEGSDGRHSEASFDMPDDAEVAAAEEDAKDKKKKKKKKGGGLFSGIVSGMTEAISAGVSKVTGERTEKGSSKKSSKRKAGDKKGDANGDDDDAEDDEEDTRTSETITAVPSKRAIAGTEGFTIDDALAIVGSLGMGGPAGEADAKHLRTHIDLLEEQRRLAEQTGDSSFHNQPVVRTLEMCFLYDLDVKAEQLRVKYQVSEKKFWHLKLRALCAASKWDAVDRLGGSGSYKKVKSPIGFLQFVEELAKYHRNDQAAAFVARLPQLSQRVEWYVKLDCFQRAADDAYNEQDAEMLQQILKRSLNPTIIQYIQNKIKALN